MQNILRRDIFRVSNHVKLATNQLVLNTRTQSRKLNTESFDERKKTGNTIVDSLCRLNSHTSTLITTISNCNLMKSPCSSVHSSHLLSLSHTKSSLYTNTNSSSSYLSTFLTPTLFSSTFVPCSNTSQMRGGFKRSRDDMNKGSGYSRGGGRGGGRGGSRGGSSRGGSSHRGDRGDNKFNSRPKFGLDRRTIESFDPVTFAQKSQWNWTKYVQEFENGDYSIPKSYSNPVINGILKRSEDPTVIFTGATQFMQKNVTPLFGQLKVFASDFIVREIDQNNTILKIESMDLPNEDVLILDEDKRKESEAESLPAILQEIQTILTPAGYEEFLRFTKIIQDTDEKKKIARARIAELRALQSERNRNMTDEERQAKLIEFTTAKSEGVERKKDDTELEIAECKKAAEIVYPLMIVDSLLDLQNKEMRKKFHTLVRSGYSSLLMTDTVESDVTLPNGTATRLPLIRITSAKGAVNTMGVNKRGKNDTDDNAPKNTNNHTRRVDARSVSDQKWPGGSNSYLRFALYKRNMDCNHVIDFIARNLRLSPQAILMSGVKDKRAITVQWLSLFRVPAHRIRSIMENYDETSFKKRRLNMISEGKSLYDPTKSIAEYQFDENAQHVLPDIITGNYHYTNEKLMVGAHNGNRFGIKLRNVRPVNVDSLQLQVSDDGVVDAKTISSVAGPQVKKTLQSLALESPTASAASGIPTTTARLTAEQIQSLESTIKQAWTKIKEHGFLNYFGTQRFGSYQVPSHVFGLLNITNQYEKNFYLSMLNLRANYPDIINKLEQGDVVSVYQTIRHSNVTERAWLQGLLEDSRNFANVFNSLPRLGRNICIHAYQSWVFNLMVSARMDPYFWDESGNVDVYKPMIGDLVLDEKIVSDTTQTEYHGLARPLTQEDLDKNTYTLHDIVFPIIRDVRSLPTNKVGELFNLILEADGITAAILDSKLPPIGSMVDKDDKDMTFIYRPMVTVPTDMNYHIDYNDNGLVDLNVEFSLPTSAYATMFLRELLHSSLFTFYEQSNSTFASSSQSDVSDAENIDGEDMSLGDELDIDTEEIQEPVN